MIISQTGKQYQIIGFTRDSTLEVYVTNGPNGFVFVRETTQHVSTIKSNINLLPVPSHFSEIRHTISELSSYKTNSSQ